MPMRSEISLKTRTVLVCTALFLVAGVCACRRGSGKDPKADSNFTATNQTDPEQTKREAQSLVDQGRELYKNDLDEEAAAAFQQAVLLHPDLAEAHLRLGMAQAALDKKDEAEQSYKKAIELFKKVVQADPKDGEAFFYLGQAHGFLYQNEEAVRAFRQAARLKPDHEEAFYQLGKAETRLARYPEAATAFQKALDLDPEDQRATDGLEIAREGAKRIRDGKKHAEVMLKKELENQNANGNTNTSSRANTNSNSGRRPAPKRSPTKP